MTQDNNWDVIVIGGGPGGSTAATLIAMDGHRVLLLEKEKFPRYHIGESLLPATIHGICSTLGVKDEIEAAGFVKKYGGTLRWGKRQDLWSFWFKDSNLFPDRPHYAFQVERSRFDHILLQNARDKGVDVREECRVNKILFDGERAVGVKATDGAGREITAHARYIVDASGLQGLLANKIGDREYDEFFRNLALFGYYENAKRLADDSQRGNIISAAFGSGWFWFIPLSDKLTSVGVVVPVEHAEKINEMGMEAALDAYIAECPVIRDLVEPAERVTDGEYGKLRILRDFSYLNSRFWAPGSVLVGDSACFIDPVFSSGVHLATYGGLLAARSINTCLRGELEEEHCFSEFELRYRREYGVFYEFLLGFYEMHQDEQSYFWRARKILNVEDGAKEAFVRLVAGLSTSGEPLFQGADDFITSAKSQSQRLAELSQAADKGGLAPETRQQVQDWGKIFFRERLQMWRTFQSAQTRDDREARELPIFEGGLVPSSDGLHWRRG